MADLLGAKLRALVKGQWGDGEREQPDFPGGAALVDGSTGWVLLEPNPVTALGAALVWADRRDLTELHLLVEAEAGVVARRAALFDPAPTVWQIDGTELAPAEAAPPATHRPATPAPQLAELLVDADLEVFVEDGVVRGEHLGLEVARIVHGTTTAGTPIDEPVLEVGVGHADREMTAMLHAGLPPTDQLARVVEIVSQHRRPDAEPHPLNQLAPERWLRALLLRDPSRIGLTELTPAEPALPRPNLRDAAVAMATGRDAAGQPVVVGIAVGVLLDLVPAAADARLALDPDARLVLVTPERDALPVTQALAARLASPAELATVPDDWRG